jgi:hypothetical protein
MFAVGMMAASSSQSVVAEEGSVVEVEVVVMRDGTRYQTQRNGETIPAYRKRPVLQ